MLVNILQDGNGRSEVKKAAVRSLIVIYSVAMLYGREALTSVSLLKELPGIQTVFTLLREAMDGNIRTEADHKLDWLLVTLLLKLIYVMCFNETT